MKIVLHIGVHKTGTSALQGFLFRNKTLLSEHGVWYNPPVGHINHSPIAQAFQTKNSGATEELISIIEEADRNKCGTCLFSSEIFCEHPFQIDELIAAVRGFDTVSVAYIRRPDEIVISAHNELVKHGWTSAIDERLPYDPTYRDVLVNWLGKRPWRLLIAPYDKSQWPSGSLFADFLRMIDVKPDGFDMSAPEDQSNRSLPAPLIEVLRVANRLDLGAARPMFVAALVELWKAHPEMYDHGSLLTDVERLRYRAQLAGQLEFYRPYLRAGFRTDFLLSDAADHDKRQD